MIAARVEHIDRVILPALQRGAIVLCDRYKDSSTVYQGMANNIAREEIDKIHEFALNTCEPDLTILLDIPFEIGIQRALGRNEIRDGYLKLASLNPERIKIIDASKSIDDISEEIYKLVTPMILQSQNK